nr:MAG TPA: hypothetical protein [Caudoviricetes sp.]
MTNHLSARQFRYCTHSQKCLSPISSYEVCRFFLSISLMV